jgi:Fic family protein
MALGRSDHSAQRFYSMSAPIRWECNAYYDLLEATQNGELDITAWLEWFLECLDRVFDGAEETLANVLRQTGFWKKHAAAPLNERQRDILNRLLDGFEGKLTSTKYALIEKTSSDTALRDINDLVGRGILKKDEGGGRSTSYSLDEDSSA